MDAAHLSNFQMNKEMLKIDREKLEQQLAELPLYQYMFLTPGDLTFTERVRHICQTECPMYNTTWACPPAVGTVEACREKCLKFTSMLVISTITEVSDIANIDETLATRAPHEAVTHQVTELVRAQTGGEVYALSTEACAICEKCAWPDAPCRHPERMCPCVESHGILVTELAEKFGLDFVNGNYVTWYSLIFYSESSAGENSDHG